MMQVVVDRRRHVTAGVALAAASVVAITPVAPITSSSVGAPVADRAVRLVADDSLLNVPINLFYDLVNMPYNFVQGLDFLARGLFFSGTWAVASSTNIFGVDPGDAPKMAGLINLLPFPALTGMNADLYDWDAGLGQQFAGFLASEAPVSMWCDAETCAPVVPTSPITGITGIDVILWYLQIWTGQVSPPLSTNWFQVPLSDLINGYTLSQDNDPEGSTHYFNPSGLANSFMGFEGTTPNPDPDAPPWEQNIEPWADSTYHLDLAKPFENYFNSLLATPATDGIFGTGIMLPTLEEIGRALQALLASMVVDFDIFTPGSPLCPGDCSFITNAHLDYPDIVKAIGNIWPGNPVIDEWVQAWDNGTANAPTADQIEYSIQMFQQPFWDFQNPYPTPEFFGDPSSVTEFFHQLWTSIGLNPPPINGEIATPYGPGIADTDVPSAEAGESLFNPVDWDDLFSLANWT